MADILKSVTSLFHSVTLGLARESKEHNDVC